MKTVRVFIERSRDGRYSAYMPDENNLEYGINGQGNTPQEAINDFKAVYQGMKEYFVEEGLKFTEVNFAFSYDVISFLTYYSDKFTFAGLEKITGVSAAQLSQYVQGYRNPSKKTAEKIQKGLHAFAQDLSQVQFV